MRPTRSILRASLAALPVAICACDRQGPPSPPPAPPTETTPGAQASRSSESGPRDTDHGGQPWGGLPSLLALPPGSTVTITEETDLGTRVEHESAEGVGAGLDTSAEKIDGNFEGSVPSAALSGGVAATGGGALSRYTGLSLPPLAANPLIWLGALCILGAGACVYFKLRRAAVICAAAGGVLIAAAMLPGWAWALLACLGVGGLAVYIWAERSGQGFKEGLRAVAAGVEDMPPAPRHDLKRRIAAHAEARDRKVIAKVKKADGLPAERDD